MSTYPEEFKMLEEQIEQLQAENKRMKTYLQFLYEGDGNIEFDELEQALKGTK